jgi:hypothetical protein
MELLSTLVVAAVVLAITLARHWILRRIEPGVAHHFDVRLEKHKHDLTLITEVPDPVISGACASLSYTSAENTMPLRGCGSSRAEQRERPSALPA